MVGTDRDGEYGEIFCFFLGKWEVLIFGVRGFFYDLFGFFVKVVFFGDWFRNLFEDGKVLILRSIFKGFFFIFLGNKVSLGILVFFFLRRELGKLSVID